MICLKLVGSYENGIEVYLYRINKIVDDIVEILENEDEYDILDNENFDNGETFLVGMSYYGDAHPSIIADSHVNIYGEDIYLPLLCDHIGIELDDESYELMNEQDNLPFEYSLGLEIEIANQEEASYGNTNARYISGDCYTEILEKLLNYEIKKRLKVRKKN